MKRIISLLLVVMMCLFSAACGKKDVKTEEEKKKSEAIQLELGKEYETEDIRLSLARVYTDEKALNFNDGEIYVALLFDIVNTTDKSIPCENVLSVETNIRGKKYTETTYEKSESKMAQSTTQQPFSANESARLHVLISVPESEEKITFNIKADGQKFKYDYTMNNDDKQVTPVEFNTKTVVDGVCEFKIIKIEATKELSALMSGNYSYKAESGSMYIDTVFEFTNTSSTEVAGDNVIDVNAKGDSGAEYSKTWIYRENATRTEISYANYESILPLSTAYLHVPVTVPESETSGELEFLIGGEFFSIGFDAAAELSLAQPLNIGDVIGTDKTVKAEIASYEFVDAVYPADTSGYYRYYKVDDENNIYLALRFNITNHSSHDTDISDTISAKAEFADKYVYKGFAVAEDAEKSSLSKNESLKPLETKTGFIIIEVPKSVVSESCRVTLAFDCSEYILSLNNPAA